MNTFVETIEGTHEFINNNEYIIINGDKYVVIERDIFVTPLVKFNVMRKVNKASKMPNHLPFWINNGKYYTLSITTETPNNIIRWKYVWSRRIFSTKPIYKFFYNEMTNKIFFSASVNLKNPLNKGKQYQFKHIVFSFDILTNLIEINNKYDTNQKMNSFIKLIQKRNFKIFTKNYTPTTPEKKTKQTTPDRKPKQTIPDAPKKANIGFSSSVSEFYKKIFDGISSLEKNSKTIFGDGKGPLSGGIFGSNPLSGVEKGHLGSNPLNGVKKGLLGSNPLSGVEKSPFGSNPLSGVEKGHLGSTPLSGVEKSPFSSGGIFGDVEKSHISSGAKSLIGTKIINVNNSIDDQKYMNLAKDEYEPSVNPIRYQTPPKKLRSLENTEQPSEIPQPSPIFSNKDGILGVKQTKLDEDDDINYDDIKSKIDIVNKINTINKEKLDDTKYTSSYIDSDKYDVKNVLEIITTPNGYIISTYKPKHHFKRQRSNAFDES